MASWAELVAQEPAFAAKVKAALDVGKHKTLATLRRDGAPRISGSEVQFSGDDLWFGSMWRARKALDLLRDPRFALHSPTTDPGDDGSSWAGEAKLSGRVEVVTDPARIAAVTGGEPSADGESMHLFRCDLDEVVHTGLSDPVEHLVIQLWRPGAGLRTFTR
jgi:Pyridoxamine 5'-phosphate oxidase